MTNTFVYKVNQLRARSTVCQEVRKLFPACYNQRQGISILGVIELNSLFLYSIFLKEMQIVTMTQNPKLECL